MAAGEPTGGDLCSGTTDGNTLTSFPDNRTERKITFGAGTALVSGKKYAIVVRAPSGSLPTNRALWQMESSGGYSNGERAISSDSGSAWTIGDGTDLWFKTYTGAGFNVLRDNYNPTEEGSSAQVAGASWIAQTFTVTSSYTITAVNLNLWKDSGQNPGTITVSIRATEEEALPSKAITPAPTNTASNILLGLGVMTWADGGGADTFNVYFGPSGNMQLVSSAQAGLFFDIGYQLNYNTSYQWRIDSTNEFGTTTGDVWSYSCIPFLPPLPTGITLTGSGGPNGEGTPTGTPTGFNNMITVRKLCAITDNRFWYESL